MMSITNPDSLWTIAAILAVVVLITRLAVQERRIRREHQRRLDERVWEIKKSSNSNDWRWPS